MKAVKILNIGAELLKMMSICDLRLQDFQYLEMYSEYIKARNANVKYNAIIYDLATRNNISESTVKRIIRRFEK
jgi:DNA-binding MarR family transcriptional regulator